MEMNKTEVAAVKAVALQADEITHELSEFELALIGGGVGEVLLG
jgi:hypothetical protein